MLPYADFFGYFLVQRQESNPAEQPELSYYKPTVEKETILARWLCVIKPPGAH